MTFGQRGQPFQSLYFHIFPDSWFPDYSLRVRLIPQTSNVAYIRRQNGVHIRVTYKGTIKDVWTLCKVFREFCLCLNIKIAAEYINYQNPLLKQSNPACHKLLFMWLQLIITLLFIMLQLYVALLYILGFTIVWTCWFLPFENKVSSNLLEGPSMRELSVTDRTVQEYSIIHYSLTITVIPN